MLAQIILFVFDQNSFHARFVHDSQFCRARNRARSHDKIFVVISNPELNPRKRFNDATTKTVNQ